LNEGSTCYALVAREAEPNIKVQIPGYITPILEEFFEIVTLSSQYTYVNTGIRYTV